MERQQLRNLAVIRLAYSAECSPEQDLGTDPVRCRHSKLAFLNNDQTASYTSLCDRSMKRESRIALEPLITKLLLFYWYHSDLLLFFGPHFHYHHHFLSLFNWK